VTSANRAATLRLDGEAVCGIYLGTIKTWNDAKIRTLNPTIANLPSATIKVVGRSDSSGTTFIFSSYLAKAATVAQKNCGYHSNFSSGEANLDDAVGTFKPAKTVPADQFSGIRSTNGAAAITSPGNSNQLLASHIKASANVYSIGYVESSYVTSTAADAGITGSIQGAVLAAQTLNAGKQVFLSPTTTTVSSALTNAKITEDPINPSSSFVQPVFATGINSYPIVGYSWIMFYHEYTNATVTSGQVQGLIVFLNWALTTGQAATHMYTGYNPLIASVRTTAILELKKIKFDGTLLWP
jgi:phosphate transport system substrate-binding protein